MSGAATPNENELAPPTRDEADLFSKRLTEAGLAFLTETMGRRQDLMMAVYFGQLTVVQAMDAFLFPAQTGDDPSASSHLSMLDAGITAGLSRRQLKALHRMTAAVFAHAEERGAIAWPGAYWPWDSC